MRRLGIGALFGLHDDWRSEALAVAAHARALLRRWWRVEVTVSLPRLRPCAGAPSPPGTLDDRHFVQLLCALRLLLPDVGLVLSTREAPAFRDAVIPLGVTHLSAGSHTEPGRLHRPVRRRAPVLGGRRAHPGRGGRRPAGGGLRPGLEGLAALLTGARASVTGLHAAHGLGSPSMDPRKLLEGRSNPLPEGTLAVGAGLIVSGITSYVFLAISARALGPERYAPLGVLWALTYVVCPGVFLPLEQEVGRALSSRRAKGLGGGPLIRRATLAGGVAAAVLIAVTAATGPLSVPHLFDDKVLLLVALMVALAGYYVEFLVRGILSGNGRFGPYGVILGAEAFLRMVACAAPGRHRRRHGRALRGPGRPLARRSPP